MVKSENFDQSGKIVKVVVVVLGPSQLGVKLRVIKSGF